MNGSRTSVHWAGKSGKTLCGIPAAKASHVTERKDDVTCGRCRRSDEKRVRDTHARELRLERRGFGWARSSE